MDAHRFRTSLVLTQAVAVATFLRSVAYDRWITVLAAALLFTGATAALRGRTWGVALSLGAAAAFPVAWLIGIAPPWFAIVGAFGALPFALAARSFARFDAKATVILAGMATATGAAGALAWKEGAWPLIREFPSLAPSFEPHHGILLAVMSAAIVALSMRRHRPNDMHVRIGSEVRVATPSSYEAEALEDATSEADAPRRRAHGR